MKLRWLIPLLLIAQALCQSTSVTGQVTDASGQTWGNGSFTFTFAGPPNVNWTGGVLNTSTAISGTTTSTGAILATSVPDNNQINPGSTQWLLKVCSATIPQTCFSSAFTITGASQVLTITPPSISIPVPTTPTLVSPVIAYADTEITGGWVGFTYYNIGLGSPRICQIVVSRNCLVWVSSSGGVAPPQTISANVSPPAINFGTVQTSTPSQVQYAAISNSGTGTVVVNVTLSGSPDFSSTQSTVCNGPLLPSATCPFPIMFTPSSGGAKTAIINISAGTFSEPATVTNACGLVGTSTTVNLCGSGTATPTFSLSYNCDPLETGSGTVTSNEATPLINFHCGANGALTGVASNNYASGSTPILTATADPGQTFTTFSGAGCGTTSPSTVTVSAAITCTASFAAPVPTEILTIGCSDQGTGTFVSDLNDVVTGTPISGTCTAGQPSGKNTGTFNQGQTPTITETPSLSGVGSCTGGNCTFKGFFGVAGCDTTGATATCPVPMTQNTTLSLDFSLPASGTWALVQHPSRTNCAAGTSCALTLTQNTGSSNLLVAIAHQGSFSSVISSMTGGCASWFISGTSAFHINESDVAYCLSSTAGVGTITFNWSVSNTPQSVEVIEASNAAGSVFDTAGTAIDSTCTSCTGILLTLTGTNNYIAQWADGTNGGAFTAISGGAGYTNPADFHGTNNGAEAGAINTANGAAPSWTQNSAHAAGVGAIAFKSSGVSTTFTFTVSCGPSGSGRVTASGIDMTCNGGIPTCTLSCSTVVQANSTITLNANPLTGSTFVNWNGAGCGTSPQCTTIAITTNTGVTVNFATVSTVQNFYVDPTGSDSTGTGTSTNPWATIAHAASALTLSSSTGNCVPSGGYVTMPNAGACVHVRTGTYNGSISTSRSGTASARIVYISETRSGAKLNAMSWTQAGSFTDAVGFEMVGDSGHSTAYALVGVAHGSLQFNLIHDYDIGTCTSDGTVSELNQPDSFNLFNGNVIRHASTYSAGVNNCVQHHGIYSEGQSPTITNNIISGHTGWGIKRNMVPGECGPAIISNNTLFNNGGGMALTEQTDSGYSGCPFDFNSVNNNLIVNNGVDTPGGGRWGMLFYSVNNAGTETHNLYSNNLLYGNLPSNFGDHFVNCNSFPCQLQTAVNTKSDASTTATFTNFRVDTNTAPDGSYNAQNYKLKSTSNGVNGGTSACAASPGLSPCAPTVDFNVVTRPIGPAIDIGAFEQ